MARAAFIMDRLMSRVGLNGKSFIPMLSSYACAIPGIMATRNTEIVLRLLDAKKIESGRATWQGLNLALPLMLLSLLGVAYQWSRKKRYGAA